MQANLPQIIQGAKYHFGNCQLVLNPDNVYFPMEEFTEPSFLGALRNEFDAEVKKVVTLELDKNLVKHSMEDIRAHLPKILPS